MLILGLMEQGNRNSSIRVFSIQNSAGIGVITGGVSRPMYDTEKFGGGFLGFAFRQSVSALNLRIQTTKVVILETIQ